MIQSNITQAEADELIAMEKWSVDSQVWPFPTAGSSVNIPLTSTDGREDFSLDIYRGRISLMKCTYQNRARHALILVRVDLDGGMHSNPDGKTVPCPHMHRYREGYGDKWAEPLPMEIFPNVSDLFQTLDEFMGYCNVTRRPLVQGGLAI